MRACLPRRLGGAFATLEGLFSLENSTLSALLSLEESTLDALFRLPDPVVDSILVLAVDELLATVRGLDTGIGGIVVPPIRDVLTRIDGGIGTLTGAVGEIRFDGDGVAGPMVDAVDRQTDDLLRSLQEQMDPFILIARASTASAASLKIIEKGGEIPKRSA